MSVRKRKWTTRNGKHKSAWVADIVDSDGTRQLQTFENKRDALVYHADMKPPRGYLSIRTKLAAALLTLERVRLGCADRKAEADEFYEHAKSMTAAQIISLFQFDHYPIRHADGGPDEPWNINPSLIQGHRTKTAKVDQPGIAKERRIEAKWKEHNRAVAAGRKPPRRTSRWPKRRMTGRKP